MRACGGEGGDCREVCGYRAGGARNASRRENLEDVIDDVNHRPVAEHMVHLQAYVVRSVERQLELFTLTHDAPTFAPRLVSSSTSKHAVRERPQLRCCQAGGVRGGGGGALAEMLVALL